MIGDALMVSLGLFALIFVGVVLLGNARPDSAERDEKWQRALVQTRVLGNGVTSFWHRHQMYPATLDDLVTAKDGGEPLVAGGPTILLDPWGKRFQFDVILNEFPSFDQIVVWTMSPRGEKIVSTTPRQ